MKNIITPLLILGLIASGCASKKYIMSDEEISEKGYSISGWDIKLKDKVIGTLDNTEWEL